MFFTVLFFCSARIANGQTTFAPAGSEWYHTMNWGVFHSYNSGDTIIAGITCRKITRKALYSKFGPRILDLPTLCVYNTTDTVFVYNSLFSRFTPLYVFNVKEGDTVRIPILQNDIGSVYAQFRDSTFSFRVDSVRMKKYDTSLLKTVYPHPLGDYDRSNYVYYYRRFRSGDTIDAYAEKLGTINAGFMPCGFPALGVSGPNTEELQLAASLRCYSEPSLSVKLTAEPCDYPREVSPELAASACISPNPEMTKLIIETHASTFTSFTLTGFLGNAFMSGAITSPKTEVDISALNPGICYILLKGPEGVRTAKFIKELPAKTK